MITFALIKCLVYRLAKLRWDCPWGPPVSGAGRSSVWQAMEQSHNQFTAGPAAAWQELAAQTRPIWGDVKKPSGYVKHLWTAVRLTVASFSDVFQLWLPSYCRNPAMAGYQANQSGSRGNYEPGFSATQIIAKSLYEVRDKLLHKCKQTDFIRKS